MNSKTMMMKDSLKKFMNEVKRKSARERRGGEKQEMAKILNRKLLSSRANTHTHRFFTISSFKLVFLSLPFFRSSTESENDDKSFCVCVCLLHSTRLRNGMFEVKRFAGCFLSLLAPSNMIEIF